MKQKARRWKFIIGITGIIGILILVCAGIRLMRKPSDTVGTIGSYPITEDHLALYEEDCRARVTAYFYNKYQQDPNVEGFWDMEFEGEVPSRMLREEAWEKLSRDTVERIEARKHGIRTDITLKEIEKSLTEENERRRKAGEVVYGPDQYGMLEYLSKTQMDVQNSLKDKLLEGELKPSEEQLQTVYEEADPALFHKGCRAEVGIYMYYGMQSGRYPKELETVWPYVKEEIRRETEPEVIVEAVARLYGVEIRYDEAEYDTDSMPRDNQALMWLAEQTQEMQPGECSDAVDFEASQGVLKMLEKDDYGMAGFEEVKTLLVNMWLDEEYPAYLERCLEEYDSR